MRTFLLTIMLSLLTFGCEPQGQKAVVVEDSTPIVGGSRTTTESLGIETLGGVFTPLIKPGRTIPCADSEVFSTAADGQSQIMLKLFRGTNQLTAANHSLGRFQIVGIPSAPRGVPQIEVKFSVTQSQILLSARDVKDKFGVQIQKISEDTKQ